MTYVMGLEAAKTPPGHRRRSARRCSACCTRAWTPACAASRSSASARTRSRPTSTARHGHRHDVRRGHPRPRPRCCAERDEGFIQITQATGDIKAGPRVRREAGRGVRAADPLQRRSRRPARTPTSTAASLQWLRQVPGQGPADLRPGRHRAAPASPSRSSTGTSTTPARRGVSVTTGTTRRRSRKMARPELCARRSQRDRGGRHAGSQASRPASAARPTSSSCRASTARPTCRSTSGAVARRDRRGRGQAPDRGDARPVAARPTSRPSSSARTAARTPTTWPR